jgi:hypothetical protein
VSDDSTKRLIQATQLRQLKIRYFLSMMAAMAANNKLGSKAPKNGGI